MIPEGFPKLIRSINPGWVAPAHALTGQVAILIPGKNFIEERSLGHEPYI
jgi:hypothetical protein